MTGVHPLAPEDLMAYLDDEVTGAEARDIQAHLAGCDACQQLAAGLRDGSQQMHEWRIDGPPASLVAPQSRRARTRGHGFSWRLRTWNVATRRLVLAGAAAVVLLAAVVMLRPVPKTVISLSGLDPTAEESESNSSVRSLAASSVIQDPAGAGMSRVQAEPATRIVRTARLRLIVSDFDRIRPTIDQILKGVGGFVGTLSASDRPDAPRSVRGTLRIPGAQFDAALDRLRALGRVIEESQGAEDVTAAVADLDVRLANARVTEQRLSDLLQKRTGDVSEVLEVEREMTRVRSDVEQMEAQRKQLDQRVEYATLTLEVTEERAAAVNLGPVPIPTRLRHAIADGVESAAMSMLETTLLVLRRGPAVLSWLIILGLPAWWVIRTYLARVA